MLSVTFAMDMEIELNGVSPFLLLKPIVDSCEKTPPFSQVFGELRKCERDELSLAIDWLCDLADVYICFFLFAFHSVLCLEVSLPIAHDEVFDDRGICSVIFEKPPFKASKHLTR